MKVSEGLQKWCNSNNDDIERLTRERLELVAKSDRLSAEILRLKLENEEIESWLAFVKKSATETPAPTQSQ